MATSSESQEPSTPEFHRIKSLDKKSLNIFTGLYYRLSVKSIPNGLMTIEHSPREEGHLIQLALNEMEHYDPPDGDLRGDSLWTLLPEPGNSDDYQLKAMSHPEASVTYTHGISWGGRYMELDLNHPEHYDPGATMHSSALWYISPCEIPDYFTIHNSDERRHPNFVTFSNEPSEKGQLMQIGTKELDYYEVKGAFRHDALWSFKPTNYELRANVTDFKFEVPTDAEISDAVLPIAFLDQVVTEENKKLDYSEDIPEIFNLSFLQSFKIFSTDENNNSISIDSTSFIDKIPFLKGKADLNFEQRSNTQWGCVINTTHRVEQEFQIPEGFTKLRVRGYCSIVKLLEIPFTAVVQVRAKADYADEKNTGCRRELVDIKDLEVIEYLLKCERFSAKVIPKVKNFKKSQKNSVDMALNDELAEVNCQVSGTLKCTCGIDTYLDVKPN